jgi:hypothetical protein
MKNKINHISREVYQLKVSRFPSAWLLDPKNRIKTLGRRTHDFPAPSANLITLWSKFPIMRSGTLYCLRRGSRTCGASIRRPTTLSAYLFQAQGTTVVMMACSDTLTTQNMPLPALWSLREIRRIDEELIQRGNQRHFIFRGGRKSIFC